MRGIFALQKSPKIDEGWDYCFNLIDMTLKRGNKAP